MKVHYLLVEAVAQALTDIFQQPKKADRVIEKMLRSNPKWGSRDRAFLAETTYECVRWARLLLFLAKNEDILRGGLADFQQLTKADFLAIIGTHLTLKAEADLGFSWYGGANWATLQDRLAHLSDRKIKASIPDWLDERAAAELGDESWSSLLTALNQPADITIRTNTMKTAMPVLAQKLAELNWPSAPTPLSSEALILKKRGNIFQTPLFKEGHFEVQDVGSQLIAPFLEVEPGHRVIDACAGAGGKALHLATLMEGKGRVIAMDVEAWKLEELKKRAKRNGLSGTIETRVIDSTKVVKRLHESADRLLLDVPCSGLGVLRRNPDAKWKLSAEFIEDIRHIQYKILTDYSKMLKVGGKMVYATCSILPAENEHQVQRFLTENPHFSLIKSQTLRPDKEGFDGFFMALMVKKA